MHISVTNTLRSKFAGQIDHHRYHQKPATMLSREQTRRIVAEMIG